MTTVKQCETILAKLNENNPEKEIFEIAYKYLTDFKIQNAKECLIASEMCGSLRKKLEQEGDKSDFTMLKIVVLTNAAKELKANAKISLNIQM